jgi:hypothetical protein
MVQAAGLEGVWQCTRFRSHEFNEDPWEMGEEATPGKATASAKRGKAKEPDPPPPPRCPKCHRLAKTDDMGLYCDNPEHGVYRLPKGDEPYWLAHLGLKAPLPDIPQANITDGGACLFGPIGHGGGGSSGRKRKKPKKPRGPFGGYYDT